MFTLCNFIFLTLCSVEVGPIVLLPEIMDRAEISVLDYGVPIKFCGCYTMFSTFIESSLWFLSWIMLELLTS